MLRGKPKVCMSSVYKPVKSLGWVVQQPKSICQAKKSVSEGSYCTALQICDREREVHINSVAKSLS